MESGSGSWVTQGVWHKTFSIGAPKLEIIETPKKNSLVLIYIGIWKSAKVFEPETTPSILMVSKT